MHRVAHNAPVIVYGEGSSAVFTIQALLQRGEHVVWAAGSGAKLLPVMPYVKSELALATLQQAQLFLEGEASFAKGTFHRVFRNKSFKMPSWKRTADLSVQASAFEEMVSDTERTFCGLQEFKITNVQITALEQMLREKIDSNALVTKVSTAPVVELEVFEQGGKIQFANGFITEFKQFFYCDSFAELKSIPKLFTILKHQVGNVKSANFQSALQVVFTHSVPLLQTLETGLMIPLTREAGENTDRHVIGYFIEPMKSIWTVFLQPEEVEENHEIMKKLRRMKQALNKAFDSPDFLPEGMKEFMATVQKEQVRFEESYLATSGSLKASAANADFVLLSDSLGFSSSLERIATEFGYDAAAVMDSSMEMGIDLSAIPNREEPAHQFDHTV